MRQILPIASNYGRFLVGIAAVAVVMPQAIAALGIERFGLWALAAATCGFIALLELGVATTAVRFAAEAEGSGDPQLRNTESGVEEDRIGWCAVEQRAITAADQTLVPWQGGAEEAEGVLPGPQRGAEACDHRSLPDHQQPRRRRQSESEQQAGHDAAHYQVAARGRRPRRRLGTGARIPIGQHLARKQDADDHTERP